jgi:hypothetical protein
MKLQDIKQVMIGGLIMDVESPDLELAANGLLGQYLADQLKIGVRSDVPPQLQANVLLHEVTHALASVYLEGVGLNEAQVAAISQGFFQVLADNPDMTEFILGGYMQEEEEVAIEAVSPRKIVENATSNGKYNAVSGKIESKEEEKIVLGQHD